MPLSRETITPETAKLFIYGAVAASTYSAVVTAIAAIFGGLWVTRWSLLDACICLGLAYGIWRRNLLCTWAAFCYFVLNRALGYFAFDVVPGSGAVVLGVVYAMAVVSVGLYPWVPERSGP